MLRIAKPVQEMMMKMTPVQPGIRCSEHTVQTEPGVQIRTEIYEPQEKEGELPGILYLHGGGFGYKAAPYHRQLACIYAERLACRVVMPDYRLLPEHPFPAALRDATAVYRWINENAGELGIDTEAVAVAGDSAGGALAACLCNLYEQEHLQQPCLQMLFYPVTDADMNTPSMKRYPDTPLWNSVNDAKMWEMYLQGTSGHDRSIASPMQNVLPSVIPQTYIEVAEIDCLHDEGVAYAEKLRTAGAQVLLTETKGTIHGYDNAMDSSITKDCVEKRIQVLYKSFRNTEIRS